jgi:hypothetical protein
VRDPRVRHRARGGCDWQVAQCAGEIRPWRAQSGRLKKGVVVPVSHARRAVEQWLDRGTRATWAAY